MPYNDRMATKLTKELAAALHATGNSELEVIDPETERTYILVDSENASPGNGGAAPPTGP